MLSGSVLAHMPTSSVLGRSIQCKVSTWIENGDVYYRLNTQTMMWKIRKRPSHCVSLNAWIKDREWRNKH